MASTCLGEDLIISAGEVNCFITNLKILKKLESTYPKHVSLDTNEANQGEVDCEQAIANFFDVLEKKVRKIERLENYTDCVIYELKEHNWFEEIMMQMVYTPSRLSDKLQKIQEADIRALQIMEKANKWCIYKKEFVELFNLIEGRPRNSSEKDVENYCARKYVVEKGLIDAKEYKVVINPKNINVEDVECENVIKVILKELQELVEKSFLDDGDFSVLDDEIECIMKKYRENKFFEYILSIDVLSNLNLTALQKDSERIKFAENVVKFLMSSIDCSSVS